MNRKQAQYHPGLSPDALRGLAAAFLAGATTPEQERSLYAAYAAAPEGSLPPDLENMRAMFAWYSGLEGKAPKSRRVPRLRIVGIAAAVAALAAVGTALVGIGGREPSHQPHAEYSTFSGSYVVRDGEVIDDLPTIYDDIITAERLSDSISRAADDSLVIEEAIRTIPDREEASALRTLIFE